MNPPKNITTQLILNPPHGFGHMRGTGIHIMGIRAKEVDAVLFQKLHRKAAGPEGQEEICIGLHQDTEIEEILPHSFGLLLIVSLDMGEEQGEERQGGSTRGHEEDKVSSV